MLTYLVALDDAEGMTEEEKMNIKHELIRQLVDAVAHVITYFSTCCAQKKHRANPRQTRNNAVSKSSSSLFWWRHWCRWW